MQKIITHLLLIILYQNHILSGWFFLFPNIYLLVNGLTMRFFHPSTKNLKQINYQLFKPSSSRTGSFFQPTSNGSMVKSLNLLGDVMTDLFQTIFLIHFAVPPIIISMIITTVMANINAKFVVRPLLLEKRGTVTKNHGAKETENPISAA